jgi:hypothetical protein
MNLSSASPPPYLLAPLSKIFENYSSSDRMSAKFLRKFCHDFALKELHSRALLRACSEISEAFGGDLSLSKFVEAISVTCSTLQLSLSQFLCEIGAKNARAVSIVVDAVHERALVHQRLKQTQRAVCLHVDGWKDRQLSKVRVSEQNPQHVTTSQQSSSVHNLPKGRGPHHILSKGNDERQPSRSRSVQLQRKDPQQLIQPVSRPVLHPQRMRPSALEAALLAEFGCVHAE